MNQPFTQLEGKVAPLDADDVDTDQIIPAQYLKVTEKSGLRSYLFYRWRYDEKGNLTGKFVLDRPEFEGARILVAGRNFGIGSSRENAVWALLDMGLRCVVASSFGDIFYNNSSKNGLLCVRLPEPVLIDLRDSGASGGLTVAVDLGQQTISYSGKKWRFDVESHVKQRLMSGMDDIAVTASEYISQIELYEETMPGYLKPRRGASPFTSQRRQ